MKIQDEVVIIETETTTTITKVPAYTKNRSGSYFYKRLSSKKCLQVLKNSSYTSIEVTSIQLMLSGGFQEITKEECESIYKDVALNLEALAFTESPETVESIINPKN